VGTRLPNVDDASSEFIRPANALRPIPPPKRNNLWYLDRGTKDVIVFVHGIFSDSRTCWLAEGHKSEHEYYWPELIARDERFDRFSIYLGGFFTDVDAGPFGLEDCAQELFDALGEPTRSAEIPILERKTLLFVCHSTGGIVVRYMLESRADAFAEKTIGLVLIASPSYGSRLVGGTLRGLAKLYRQKLGRQLKWGNWGLEDLDRRFQLLLSQRRIPHLIGAEAYENRFIFHRKWLPRLPWLVVERESAARYFPPARQLAGTDHFTTVKPNGAKHPSHVFLCRFLRELERQEQSWGIKEETVFTDMSSGFSLEALGTTMSNPRYEDDSRRLEPVYDRDAVINMETIILVVGVWIFAELLDRTFAEVLRNQINKIGRVEEYPFRRAIILTDAAWFADKDIANNPVIAIGGPAVNRLSAEFDKWQAPPGSAEGKYPISGDHLLTGFFRKNARGLPQVALWGKTSRETKEAVEYYTQAEKGLAEFCRLVWHRY
jgi:hypothetical protein